MTQKLVTVVLVLLLSSTIVHAQKISSSKVPAAVKTSFSKAHPGINKVAWELEDGMYEAGYTKNKVEISELYGKAGALMETETAIKVASLPAGVSAYVKQHYKGASIKEAAKITDSKGVVTYEAEVKGKDLIFNEVGHFVKQTKN
jgi:hypothetical protein